MRSVDDAISWLEGQMRNRSQSWGGLCLSLAAHAYGFPASGVGSYGRANPNTWVSSGKYQGNTRGTPPRGALVVWTGGTNGHIAISDGAGNVYTNLSDGSVGKMSVRKITDTWGLKYQGWSSPAFPAGNFRVAPGFDSKATGTESSMPAITYNPGGSGGTWLVKFLAAHGLQGDELRKAWAIAMRESNGTNIDSNDPNFNGADYGLFQINEVHAGRIKEKFGWTMDQVGSDPEKNFRIYMWMSQRGKDLSAWNMGPDPYDPSNSAMHTGMYQKWLGQFDQYAKKAGVDPSRNYSGGGGGLSATGSDKLDPQTLLDQFGWTMDVVNSRKDLKQLFADATANNWTPTRFAAELKNTPWYQEHSAYWRTAWTQEKLGGKDWDTKLQTARATVAAEAAKLGAEPTPEELDKYARMYLYRGWDQPGRQTLLFKHLAESIGRDGSMGGSSADLERQLRDLADRNGLSKNYDFYVEAARQVATGAKTVQEYEAMIREEAASLFPVYRDKIMAGQNVDDLASSYTNMMADVLEIPHQKIKLKDDLIQRAVNGVDPKTNQPAAMSLWDFKKVLRQDSRWQYTEKANEEVGTMAQRIAQMMGF